MALTQTPTTYSYPTQQQNNAGQPMYEQYPAPNNQMQPEQNNPAVMQRMMMARQLMGQQANPTTPFAGLANIGSSLAGASMMNHAQNQMQNPGLQPVNVTPAQNASLGQRIGNFAANKWPSLFSFGGSN